MKRIEPNDDEERNLILQLRNESMNALNKHQESYSIADPSLQSSDRCYKYDKDHFAINVDRLSDWIYYDSLVESLYVHLHVVCSKHVPITCSGHNTGTEGLDSTIALLQSILLLLQPEASVIFSQYSVLIDARV